MNSRRLTIWAGFWLVVGCALAGCQPAPRTLPAKGAPAAPPPASLAAAGSPRANELEPAPVWETLARDGAPPISLTASDGTGLRLASIEASTVHEPPLALRSCAWCSTTRAAARVEGRFRMRLPERAKLARLAMKVGTAEVSGRLPPEVIQRIVRQNFGRIRLCYEHALQSNPNVAGTAIVRFRIGRDGSVEPQVLVTPSFASPALSDCIARVFRNLAFPAPEGGKVVVSYPIRLGDGGMPPQPNADASQPAKNVPEEPPAAAA